MPARSIVACALAGCMTVACAAGNRPEAAAPTPRKDAPSATGTERSGAPRPSASLSAATPAAPAGGLAVRSIARISVPASDPEQVDLFGERLVWGGHGARPGGGNAVYLHDLRTKRTRVIARPATADGKTPWARGSRDTVVYVDCSPGEWRIYLLSLATGKRRIIGRSRGKVSGNFLPSPTISWPWVAWDDPEPDNDPDLDAAPVSSLRVLDLRSGASQTVRRSRLFQPVLDGAVLSFVGVHGDSFLQDAYAVDLAASRPQVRQLTSTGDVGGLTAGEGYTVYYAPARGDAHAVSRVPSRGGRPEVLARPGGGDLAAGTGFVIWFGTGVVIKRTDDPSPPRPLLRERRSVITRLAADGNRAVFGEDQPGAKDPDGTFPLTGRVVLHVVEVTPQ